MEKDYTLRIDIAIGVKDQLFIGWRMEVAPISSSLKLTFFMSQVSMSHGTFDQI